jgi:hypothetical protein
MFSPTNNVYKFLYLQTGISGSGLEGVWLPEVPDASKIIFKKEQRWTRPVMPDNLKREVRKIRLLLDPESKSYNPDYISPLAGEIKKWEDREWDRSTDGVWIWSNGVPTYITGFYYWFLSSWELNFGFPDFRETDKEITYMLQYCEEDPDCFGLLLNTIRRYGKSSLMGSWATYRTTRNRKHYSGMQGEKDEKIAQFYYQMILQPFKKLPYYFKPSYNEGTKQTRGIAFERTTRRGKKSIEELLEEEEDDSVLESYLDYRPSGEAEYDGSILHTYIGEEPGKVLACSIHERWKIVKPCLRKGKVIRGKCFMGTTVEFMDVTDKGGRAYQKLFYESDFNDKKGDGRTKSGLYAAFLPGDTAYEGFFDDYGHPMKDRARQSLLLERESVKDSPKDLSDLIRKYPLTISEIFWVSSEKCIFNVTILQKRKFKIDSSTAPMYSRYDLDWENKKRFSKIIIKHNPVGGWYKASWMFPGAEYSTMANQVKKNPDGTYSPLLEDRFTSGLDPVDHRVVIQERMTGDEEYASSRRSKPVMRVKRRYDSAIDGVLTQELLEQRRDEEYQYKTGISIGYMDGRTADPNIYYERCLMICWLFGMSVNVESAKPGVINYFYEHGCQDFIKNKYIPESDTKSRAVESGTPANSMTINEYIEALMFEVEYFFHCEPFVDFINDHLIFNPAKTKEHDYTVASGWCSLGEKIRAKTVQLPTMDLSDIMPVFDNRGNVVQWGKVGNS